MTRLRSAAGAVLAAAAFAGCGGGDDNQALSYSEFGREADEICAAANAEIEPLTQRLTGEPENDAPILDEIIAEQEPAIADFRALDPPEELQANFDKFLEISDQQLSIAKEAQTAAENGDRDAYLAEVEKLQPLDEQSNVEASKLGAAECAS